MFVMVLLSMMVGLRMLQLRYRAVLQDNLPIGYFEHNRGAKPPAYMMQADQNFTNLYETPVLFYAGVILIYVLNMTNLFSLTMSWAYVGSRIMHSYVHMGPNHVAIRRNSFLAGIAILGVLWSYMLIGLLTR
jgi:hypothetical protein